MRELKVFSVLYLVFPLLAFTQNVNYYSEIDSLIQIADSLRGIRHSYKSAEVVINRAVQIAKENNDHKGLGNAYVQKGRILKSSGQYNKALNSYRKALIIRRDSLKDTCAIASVYNNMSSTIFRDEAASDEKLMEALSYSQKAVNLSQQKNCTTITHRALNNLANHYSDLGYLDSAIITNLINNQLFSTLKDTITRIENGYNLASRYLETGEYLDASLELDTCFNLYHQVNTQDSMLLGSLYELKGIVKLRVFEYQSALQLFEQAEKIYLRFPEAEDALSNIYFNLATIYENQQNFEAARKAYEIGLNYIGYNPDLEDVFITRIQLIATTKEKFKQGRRITQLLIILLLVATTVAILAILLFRKEKRNAHLKLENSKLRHDIVKNDLRVIDNYINIKLSELKANQTIYHSILKIRNMIRLLLNKIGYPQEGNQRPRFLKAFVREMHDRATEAALLEVDNYSYLDEVENYPLSPRLRNELETIITEVFMNIRKHASCQKASILFTVDDHGLGLTIEDDGRGFDLNNIEASGLKNIKSRVKALNGNIQIISSPGKGTKIKIIISRFPEPQEAFKSESPE